MGEADLFDQRLPLMVGSYKMKKLVIKDSDSIRRKVYAHLREQILNGQIAPQQRLIETRIARAIGTSRTPVREALHNLEVEGLIESIPRVGYRVKFLNPAEVEEICAIRATIERMAADWAMNKAPNKLVSELKKNIARSEKAIAQGAFKAFVELDAQFHEIIARLSGSPRLLELAQTLRRHMLRYRIESIYTLDNVRRAIDGHTGILQAIVQADRPGVGQAISAHLEQSKRDILRYAFGLG